VYTKLCVKIMKIKQSDVEFVLVVVVVVVLVDAVEVMVLV
jgi:hypothetical protein